MVSTSAFPASISVFSILISVFSVSESAAASATAAEALSVPGYNGILRFGRFIFRSGNVHRFGFGALFGSDLGDRCGFSRGGCLRIFGFRNLRHVGLRPVNGLFPDLYGRSFRLFELGLRIHGRFRPGRIPGRIFR